MHFRVHFSQVSHCFREANLPADRLSIVVVLDASDKVYDSFSAF